MSRPSASQRRLGLHVPKILRMAWNPRWGVSRGLRAAASVYVRARRRTSRTIWSTLADVDLWFNQSLPSNYRQLVFPAEMPSNPCFSRQGAKWRLFGQDSTVFRRRLIAYARGPETTFSNALIVIA
jgi:hypothetical protein